jgi:hypothetical protein
MNPGIEIDLGNPRQGLVHIEGVVLAVVRRAARLGLIAPFTIETWSNWWAETDLSKTPPRIRISEMLETRWGRDRVAANYRPVIQDCTPENIVAHEIGHAFLEYWKHRRGFAPIRGYQKVFNGVLQFNDPWDDLGELMASDSGFTYDRSEFLNAYAWSDPDEDFADVYAEVVTRAGRIPEFRRRPGVYRKMEFLLVAGQRILEANPCLCCRCDKKGRRICMTIAPKAAQSLKGGAP